MNQIVLALSMPPSLNRTYKTGNGRFYKDDVANKWVTDALWNIKALKIPKLPKGRYSLSLTLHGLRKNADLDNRVKIVQDLLQASGIIENDKHIDRLHVYRGLPGKPALVDILVELIPE